ncbi:MAG: hypothetical protein AAGH15_11925 [Myxococcota bacterium]
MKGCAFVILAVCAGCTSSRVVGDAASRDGGRSGVDLGLGTDAGREADAGRDLGTDAGRDLGGDAGCGADLSRDPENCGACGVSCMAAPGARAVCMAGTCGIACRANRGDCNAEPLDGCEVRLLESNDHCGRCDAPCTPGSACVDGECEGPPP